MNNNNHLQPPDIQRLRREASRKSISNKFGSRSSVRSTVYVAKQFAEDTTFHGLGHIWNSGSSWAKRFWVTILVIVVTIVVWQITVLAIQFIGNPTATNLKLVQPKDGLPLPPVTICTLQKFNNTRLKHAYPGMSKLLADFASTSFFSPYSTALMDPLFFNARNSSVEQLAQALKDVLGQHSVTDFVKNVSFECSRSQFVFCWFENGYVFDCCNSSSPFYMKKFFIHSGACFEIEATTNLHQRLPGPVGGFGFVYWHPLDDLFPTAYNAYDENGLHIYTSPTEAMLEKNPVVLPVGTHARINLQATKTDRLTVDQLGRTICTEKSLKYFANYSYAACQVECLLDKLLEECNCIGINTYGNLPKEKICTPMEAYNCFLRLAFQFSTLLTKCRLENCTEACNYWTYKVSLSAGSIFNRVNQHEMTEHWRLPSGKDPKESLIIADVYFSDIEYLGIREVTSMSFVSFVSNLGGAMGLWTGASIITWIHVIYFCMKVILKKKRQRKQGRSYHLKGKRVVSNSDC